jgi:hypothetical protein
LQIQKDVCLNIGFFMSFFKEVVSVLQVDILLNKRVLIFLIFFVQVRASQWIFDRQYMSRSCKEKGAWAIRYVTKAGGTKIQSIEENEAYIR